MLGKGGESLIKCWDMLGFVKGGIACEEARALARCREKKKKKKKMLNE